jgi:hypothetical protein
MANFKIYEEMLTEYNFVDDFQKPNELFEAEADSPDEAYRQFVEQFPHKARTQVIVKSGRLEKRFGHD